MDSQIDTEKHYNVMHDDNELTTYSSVYRSYSLLDPIRRWLYHSAWPGLGLFGESYLLFSIGTLRPIWEILFPNCFSYEECPRGLINSLTYSVILGIITGMVVVGYLANSIGRRRGSIMTASLMASGALVLLFICIFLIDSPIRLYSSMTVTLFIFGIGVGGEYPLSAASASEKAMQHQLLREKFSGNSQIEKDSQAFQSLDQTTRGRAIQLVFTMQGVGIWCNCLTILTLLFITGQTGNDQNEYNHDMLILIWRITYLIGTLVLSFLLITRCIYLKESEVWAHDKQQQEQVVNQREVISDEQKSDIYSSIEFAKDLRNSPIWLLLSTYGMRLFGASSLWLLWDVTFYGNKLFQSSFLLAVMGEDISLYGFAAAATMNATAALLGYFGAALLIDNQNVGRLRLQVLGFFITGLLFLICGVSFGHLSSPLLVTIRFYFFTSFFGQLGPNATTFLIPAEIFPTEMRTFCHGICAASGKIGALLSAILFPYFNTDTELFLCCCICSFVACAITVWTIPDTTGMDLLEIDKKWRMITTGCETDYNGQANYPIYLSVYERRKIRY